MRADGGAVLEFAYEVGAAADLDEFRTIVTTGVAGLVGCDLASYTEIDLGRRSAIAMVDHPISNAGYIVSALGRVADQNPLITRRVGHAQTISDYLSRRQFAALAIYSDVYRHLGAGDQIAINLMSDRRKVIGIALNRPRPSFGTADRLALDRLRPLLTRGYREVLTRERARRLVEHLDAGGGAERVAVAACDTTGRLLYASDRALGLLRGYAGRSRLAERFSPTGMTIRGERGVLEMIPAPSAPHDAILFELRERRAETAAGKLTPRERQILGRVAAGESNQQIAEALGVSRYTVQNHLQSIYRKLDVTSRTAAVAVLGAASGAAEP
jgi:RNA polymerase sigma factor (sigma-70 family)